MNVFVSCDAAACSVGADQVAQALEVEAKRRNLTLSVTRTGSRGLLWLEPLIEVETAAGRVGYGPVDLADVSSLFEAKFFEGAAHPLHVGLVERVPQFAQQTRLTFARVGVTAPLSVPQFRKHGGFVGLARAKTMTPAAIIEEVLASGLRGSRRRGLSRRHQVEDGLSSAWPAQVCGVQCRRRRLRHLRRPHVDGRRPVLAPRRHAHRRARRRRLAWTHLSPLRIPTRHHHHVAGH